MTDKKRVFVIMPFSKTIEHHTEQYWTRHFNSYLKPLVERNENLEAFRSQPLRGDIASQIITDLTTSDIVVADLTDHNPNVLWELGVRQSYKQCTITIAEVGTEIPFHFSHKGMLFYNGEHLDNQEFEEKFSNALKNCVECPDDVDSPVLAALGGRGTLYSIIHAEEIARRIEALQVEISDNNYFANKIWEHCERNKNVRTSKKGTYSMVGDTLKYAAIELLYVERYIDAVADFYRCVTDYYGIVHAINYHITGWQVNQEAFDEWLAIQKDDFQERATQLKRYLKKIAGKQ